MSIVERIKTECQKKNTSMNALEKELEFGNGSIRLWDKKIPGSDKVIKVAERLDLSLDYLLTGKEATDLIPEEHKLVELYRNADDRGKRNIMTTAENENKENQSSVSKIG